MHDIRKCIMYEFVSKTGDNFIFNILDTKKKLEININDITINNTEIKKYTIYVSSKLAYTEMGLVKDFFIDSGANEIKNQEETNNSGGKKARKTKKTTKKSLKHRRKTNKNK